MKPREFIRKLKLLIDADETLVNLRPDSSLFQILGFAEVYHKLQMAQILGAVRANITQSESFPSSKAVMRLNDFSPFVAATCSKAFADDFKLLVTLLVDSDGMDMRDILRNIKTLDSKSPKAETTPVSVQLIDDYQSQLTDLIDKPEAFEAAFARLKADKRMTKDHVLVLASRMAFKMPSDASKSAALNKIFDQHRYVVSGMKSSLASSGKTAA